MIKMNENWTLGHVIKEDGIVTFKKMRQLTNIEWETYSKSLDDIYKIDEEIALFHMIYINYIDFDQYMKYIINSLHEGPSPQSKVKTHVNNLNCKLNNFLSSIKLFLDHFERRLKDEYGKKSKEIQLFKNETSRLYDEYFSYRFLYHLRNYIQHRNVAISKLEIHENEYNISLSIALNRKKLLSDYRWKNDVKKDLITQNDYIEIFPLMSEMLDNLKELTKLLIKEEIIKIKSSLNFIINLINEIGNPGAILMQRNGDKLNYSEFPLEVIHFINYIIN